MLGKKIIVSDSPQKFKGEAESPFFKQFLESECLQDPQVFIELTSHCNFTCSYCYSKDSDRKSMMSDKLFYSVIDQLGAITSQPIRLHCDGEPTLHKKFIEYVSAINERGMRVALVTNGSTLNKSYLNLGMDLNIHLSTSAEELKDRFTGSFDKYTERLQDYLTYWLEANSDQNINYNIYLSLEQRRSEKELHRIRTFLSEFISGAKFTETGDEKLRPQSTWFIHRNPRGRLFRINTSNIASGGMYPDTEKKKKASLRRDFGFCDSPWKRLVILADGKIQPCCLDLFGTLAYTSPDEITSTNLKSLWLDDARINKVRANILDGNITHSTCQQCLDRIPSRELYAAFYKHFD